MRNEQQEGHQKKYNTKNKDAIREYLRMHREHSFSAYDVNEYMQENGIRINLATIYRNLDKLTESGEVMKYKTADDGFCRYQCARPYAQCHEHIHMQCRECGRLLHLECDFMEEIARHLYEHHKFTIECSGSVLMGICADCKTKTDR